MIDQSSNKYKVGVFIFNTKLKDRVAFSFESITVNVCNQLYASLHGIVEASKFRMS